MRCSRSIDVDFKPTTQPGVWLGVLRVVDQGHEVIVSDFYRLGPGRPGFDRMRDAISWSRALPYAAPHVPYAYEVGWPDVLNPIKWVGAAKDAAGAVGKPAIYAASIFTGGVPGLVAAYAADKTGVIDALGQLMEKAGGVFMDLIGSIWFQALCSSVSILVGVSELGYGCILASLGMEILNIIVRKQPEKIPGVVRRASQAVIAFGIDVTKVMDGLFSVMFTGMKDAGLNVDTLMKDGIAPIAAEFKKNGMDPKVVDRYTENILKKYSTGALQQYVTNKVADTTSNAMVNVVKLPKSNEKTTDPNKLQKGPATALAPGVIDIRKVPDVPTKSFMVPSLFASTNPFLRIDDVSKPIHLSRDTIISFKPDQRRKWAYALAALGLGVVVVNSLK